MNFKWKFIMQKKATLLLSFCAVVMSSLCFGMNEDVPLTALPETVTIQTSDEQTFEVARDVYRFSQTITNMLHDCGEDLSFVPLPNVSADIWNTICTFLKYIRDNQLDGLKSELMSKELHELSELLTTANYLDIHPLLDCIADVIAQKLCSQEDKTNFIENANFLANAGLK